MPERHHAPSEFPPPVDSQDEFIKRGLDAEDDLIEVGVAIIGGGTAGLAAANRLLQLLADDPELLESLGEVPVAVVEKAKTCGSRPSARSNSRIAAPVRCPQLPSASTVTFALMSVPGSKLLSGCPSLPRPLSPDRTPTTTPSSTISCAAAVSVST